MDRQYLAGIQKRKEVRPRARGKEEISLRFLSVFAHHASQRKNKRRL